MVIKEISFKATHTQFLGATQLQIEMICHNFSELMHHNMLMTCKIQYILTILRLFAHNSEQHEAQQANVTRTGDNNTWL